MRHLISKEGQSQKTIMLIEIDQDEYNELVSDSKFLELLIAYGVDNWEGYDEVQKEFSEG